MQRHGYVHTGVIKRKIQPRKKYPQTAQQLWELVDSDAESVKRRRPTPPILSIWPPRRRLKTVVVGRVSTAPVSHRAELVHSGQYWFHSCHYCDHSVRSTGGKTPFGHTAVGVDFRPVQGPGPHHFSGPWHPPYPKFCLGEKFAMWFFIACLHMSSAISIQLRLLGVKYTKCAGGRGSVSDPSGGANPEKI